jgi:hypothetical protein
LNPRIADVRLITAAPELLAACKLVMSAADEGVSLSDPDWAQLRAAIARATVDPRAAKAKPSTMDPRRDGVDASGSQGGVS